MAAIPNLTEVLATLRQIAASVPMEDRILRIEEVSEVTGLPRAQVYRLEKQSDFPARVSLTPEGRSVGWRASEVQDWIRSRPRVITDPSV